jgi:ribosomal protein S18 acetylase RimI-like enzyme
MKYRILPIEEKYIEGYSAAVDQVAREKLYLAFLEGPPLAASRDFVLENLQKNMPHFVALMDDSVVGWCDISSFDRPVFAHAGILGMGIIAPHRDKGIGKALMNKTLEKARAIGLTRIELEVREENDRAIKLYEKCGFAVEGIKRNATCIDGKYSNDLIMALLF